VAFAMGEEVKAATDNDCIKAIVGGQRIRTVSHANAVVSAADMEVTVRAAGSDRIGTSYKVHLIVTLVSEKRILSMANEDIGAGMGDIDGVGS
jgi:hypothetical protein